MTRASYKSNKRELRLGDGVQSNKATFANFFFAKGNDFLKIFRVCVAGDVVTKNRSACVCGLRKLVFALGHVFVFSYGLLEFFPMGCMCFFGL